MREPTDRLRRYGEDIASAVSPARSRVAAMRAVGQAPRTPTRRRTPQFAFATLGVFLVANIVMSGVANAAVPGDVLYPVDRGYEMVMDLVGLDGDHGEERIVEAEVLLDRGDLIGAADLVAEATDNDSVLDAVATLQAGNPSDSRFGESVQALVASARHLVAARQAGEATGMAEAEAALDLAAMHVTDATRPEHAGTPGTPRHAEEQGPPDHSRDDENPGREDTPAADPPGPPAETPGQPENPPGEPASPPGQAQDPPGQSDPPGRSQDPPENSQQPSGESGGQGQPDGPQDQPGRGGSRTNR